MRLIDGRADVNFESETKGLLRRPLHEAAAQVAHDLHHKREKPILHALQGHEIACTALVEARAEVNALDLLGVSALHLAAEGGHLFSVRELLNTGADPNDPPRTRTVL